MAASRKRIKLSPDSDIIEPDILQAAHELLEISSATSPENVSVTPVSTPNLVLYELNSLIDAIKHADEIGHKIIGTIENIAHCVITNSLFAHTTEFIIKPITALHELCKRRNNIDWPNTHFKLRIRVQGNSIDSNRIIKFVPLFIPTMNLSLAETIARYNVLICKYRDTIRIIESIYEELFDDYKQLFRGKDKPTYIKHCEIRTEILKDVCRKQRGGFILTTIFMKMLQNTGVVGVR